MREIYYAIYKNSQYDIILFTLIAEVINFKKAKFINNKLVLEKRKSFNKYERQLFKKIYINRTSNFHLSDYHKWVDAMKNDCFEKGYFSKLLFFNFKTKYFKTQIKQTLLNNGFNQSIIDFINTGNIEYLLKIDKNFKKIFLPKFVTQLSNKYPYNIDSLDIVNEASENRAGMFRRP